MNDTDIVVGGPKIIIDDYKSNTWNNKTLKNVINAKPTKIKIRNVVLDSRNRAALGHQFNIRKASNNIHK